MSITGVNNPLTAGLGALGRPLSAPTPGGTGGAGTLVGTRPGVTRPAAAPARPATTPLSGAPATLPSEAPAGTDPELWGVLTTEERTFFAKSSASGPLTYGRMAAGVQALQGNTAAANAFGAAARGARLDVRG